MWYLRYKYGQKIERSLIAAIVIEATIVEIPLPSHTDIHNNQKSLDRLQMPEF